jgi:hypothetical protein
MQAASSRLPYDAALHRRHDPATASGSITQADQLVSA